MSHNDKERKKPRLISKSTHLTGQVQADLIIASPANVQLHGTLVGDIRLLPGSELAVHGKVVGAIVNQGGKLSIFGSVTGGVKQESGTTYIDPQASAKLS